MSGLAGLQRRIKIVGQQWDRLLQAVLDERRNARRRSGGNGGGGGSGATDLLDVLISLGDLTDDNIKAVIADMFLGGTETTSITIEWGLAELLANPHVLKTLQNDLDVVVGKARDPNLWDNPLQFDPDRFMEKERCSHVNVPGRHFELLPFGSGKRKCPALSLGLLTVHIVIASLVQAFEWQLPLSSHLVDLSEKFGLSFTLASPLCITPSPRIDASKCYQNTI
ncbi:hypothetical protein L7F22_035698 [Adiantum nelumboides]|nr:hypothetical protein [Adiantum nelumboides]